MVKIIIKENEFSFCKMKEFEGNNSSFLTNKHE